MTVIARETLVHWFPAGLIATSVNVGTDLVPITKYPGKVVNAGNELAIVVAVIVALIPPIILYEPANVEDDAIASKPVVTSFKRIEVLVKFDQPEVIEAAQYLFVSIEPIKLTPVPPVLASKTSVWTTTGPPELVFGLTNSKAFIALLPTGIKYVEPEAKLAGNVISNGPFTKAVVDDLLIADVYVLVIFKILEEVVVILPQPVLNLRAVVDKFPPANSMPFEFELIIFDTILVEGIS